jgi:hypothetical protein
VNVPLGSWFDCAYAIVPDAGATVPDTANPAHLGLIFCDLERIAAPGRA